MSEIENCPFCGGNNLSALCPEDDQLCAVYCLGVYCEYASGKSREGKHGAIAAHNRVSRAVQKENAKPLREKLKDAGMTLPPGYDGSEIFD